MILLEPANTIIHFNVEIKRRTISLMGFSETTPAAGSLPTQTKVPFFSATPLREQEHVQLEVVWTKTRLLAARAFAFEAVSALWAAV